MKFSIKTIVLLLLCLFFSVQITYCQVSDSVDVELHPDSLINKRIPYFSGTSITGQNWNSDKLKGKVVLLNFWFIGCFPCMKEIKYLNEINKEFQGKDFILLSIAPQLKEDLTNFNGADTNKIPAAVRLKLKVEPITYEIISACDKRKNDLNRLGPECKNISNDFLVDGYPTTFFIDKFGIIRYVEDGFPFTEDLMKSSINKYKDRIDKLLRE